ncbi:plasmid partitioning protein RepB C-terminal domain-containing protein [Phenylobacterium sp.]|uniref:plasmid partitioning protein RepB C-terminal domain-containing protein n=1 Tax=Phenylobacterium sp. TaxID=1871053 RepID=UPI002FCA3B94
MAAALALADAAGEGRSTELRLPPGTGKTIVANMAALAYRSLRPASRVMLVAPRPGRPAWALRDLVVSVHALGPRQRRARLAAAPAVGGLREVRPHHRVAAPEVAVLLKDSQCSFAVFDVLRKMGPMRQLEAAELMLGHNNFGKAFALALLAATPEGHLASTKGKRKPAPETSAVTREQVARLERGARRAAGADQGRGGDLRHRQPAPHGRQGLVTRLFGNAQVVRWLAQHKPEYLSEFQAISELLSLPVEGVMSPGSQA